MAMLPGASVSGLYFWHPEAHYFGLGRIGRDQLDDYARRKGWSIAEAERWLALNVAEERRAGPAAAWMSGSVLGQANRMRPQFGWDAVGSRRSSPGRGRRSRGASSCTPPVRRVERLCCGTRPSRVELLACPDQPFSCHPLRHGLVIG